MAGTVAPFCFWQSFDDNGDPIDGGQLFVYESGTSTKATTYSNAALTTPNTNPIILDAAGRATIFLAPGTYKFVLAPADDTDPPTSPLETMDGVQATPGISGTVDWTGTAGQTVVANDILYLSVGSGGKTAGRWYKADATYPYSSSQAGAIGFATEGGDAGDSIVIRGFGLMTGFGSLAPGYMYYVDSTPGAITVTAPSHARPVGVAQSATDVLMDGPVPVVFNSNPKRQFGVTAPEFQATIPMIFQSGYSGGSTTTPEFTVPAGTINVDGDILECEWATDYSSATLSARLTVNATTKDATTGGNTTVTWARAIMTRTSATTFDIVWHGQQSAVAFTAHDTVAVSDLAANSFTLKMGMASGTYTIRGYRIKFYPTQ